MSNGTKVSLGLIVFALGMLIMVSAFCPPSWYGETDCAATSENKSNRRVVKCLRFSNLIDRACVFRHIRQSHSTIQRLLPSAEGNVEINRKHGKHCPLRKASRVCF